MLNIGFFYQMWYTNQRAIFESFKLLRAIYPDSDLTLLVTGISKDEVENLPKYKKGNGVGYQIIRNIIRSCVS